MNPDPESPIPNPQSDTPHSDTPQSAFRNPQSDVPQSRIRVLYAEDNPLDVDLTRSHFADAAPDFTLEAVDTGAACLARVAREEFDVLLLDNHLPDMDGTDVLGRLLAQGCTLPVVMVTGSGDEEIVARALRAGASDYLPKAGDYLVRLPAMLRNIVCEHRRQATLGRTITTASRSILYVESSVIDAELTVQHFSNAAPHLKLTTVRTCAEALAVLAAPHAFDLVLTDLRLPGMNALEFLHEAKHRGIHLPFIVITGRGDEETAVAILRLGAYDYMVKRENYLTQLTYSIDSAIHRFQLAQMSERLQRELAELNESLEQKVRERTAVLEREVAERRRAEEKVSQLLERAERSRRALLGIMEDQKRAEAALRESEERLRLAVQAANVGLWDWNLRTDRVVYSREWKSQLGYAENEIADDFEEWRSRVHPDDLPGTLAAVQAARDAPTGGYDVEFRMRHRDGSWRWILVKGSVFRDAAGQPVRMMGSHVDITERKQAEEALRDHALRLRDLSQRLIEVQEEERRALARELHDRIGQNLSALNLTLGIIGARLPETARNAVGAQLNDAQNVLSEVTRGVRNVMVELRPPALDDYGLLAALRNLGMEHAQRAGLAADVKGVDVVPRPPIAVETTLYRIAQEALINVVKHARAAKVEVTIDATPEQIVMQIADDGVGVAATRAPGAAPTWGMATMRERAEAVGATLSVESAPGAGTKVIVRAPRGGGKVNAE